MIWIVTLVDLNYDDVNDLEHFVFDSYEAAEEAATELRKIYYEVWLEEVDIVNKINYWPRPRKRYQTIIKFIEGVVHARNEFDSRSDAELPEPTIATVGNDGRLRYPWIVGHGWTQEDADTQAFGIYEEVLDTIKPEDFTYVSGCIRDYVLSNRIVDGWYQIDGHTKVNIETGDMWELRAFDKATGKKPSIVMSGMEYTWKWVKQPPRQGGSG